MCCKVFEKFEVENQIGPEPFFYERTYCWTSGTPVVMSLKFDGKTPRICDDHRFTLNSRLLKRVCTGVEAEDIINQRLGSRVCSKFDLKGPFLNQSLSTMRTIGTHFGIFRYNLLPSDTSYYPEIFKEVMNNAFSNLKDEEFY